MLASAVVVAKIKCLVSPTQEADLGGGGPGEGLSPEFWVAMLALPARDDPVLVRFLCCACKFRRENNSYESDVAA